MACGRRCESNTVESQPLVSRTENALGPVYTATNWAMDIDFKAARLGSPSSRTV